MKPRILIIDDDMNLLSAMKRQLYKRFDVELAGGGADAVLLLEDEEEQFDIIMSDMRMPGLTGADVLTRARTLRPKAVRILLTGESNLENAAKAVNDGGIFRFLLKPCPPAELMAALDAALEQHALLHTEDTMMNTTVRGSIDALVQTLALVAPGVVGRSNRVRELAQKVTEELGMSMRWTLDCAALLLEVGALTIPEHTLQKRALGHALSTDEKAMIAAMPDVGDSILENVPKLEDVRWLIRAAHHGTSAASTEDYTLQIERDILRAASSFDAAFSRCDELDVAAEAVGIDWPDIDPMVFEALRDVVVGEELNTFIEDVAMTGLLPGMVIVEDIRNAENVLLVAKGTPVTPGLQRRLMNFSRDQGLPASVRVRRENRPSLHVA